LKKSRTDACQSLIQELNFVEKCITFQQNQWSAAPRSQTGQRDLHSSTVIPKAAATVSTGIPAAIIVLIAATYPVVLQILVYVYIPRASFCRFSPEV